MGRGKLSRDDKNAHKSLPFEPGEVVQLAPEAQRAYDAVVRPNAIVPIPRYFMDSWLPLLGTSRSWVTLAFRQVAFVSRSGNQEVPVRTTLRKLGRWCGVSHVRVHQVLKNPGYLTWFVRNPDGDIAERRTPRSEPTTYMVRSDIPFTPEDQARLTLWLDERGPSDDADWVHAIEEAVEARDVELPKDHPLPEISLTVQKIVYAQRGDETPLPPSLDEACTELHSRWVQPERVTLATHYFIVRWLPDLSPGLGWLILHLRSRTYLQEERQVGQVWIAGGWKGLAASIGVSRKSLSRWVNSDIADLFFKRRKDTKDPTNRRSILLYVRMSEPIHPNDDDEYRERLERQDLTSPISLDRQELTNITNVEGQGLTDGGKQSTERSRNLTSPGQELPDVQQNLTRDEPRLNKLRTILNALSPSKFSSKLIFQESSSLPDSQPAPEVAGMTEKRPSEQASEQVSQQQDPTGPKVWSAAKSQLQLELSKAMYDTWVRDVELIEFGGETIMLGATNDYARDWLTDRLNSKIERIITGIIGKEIKVQFVVLDDVEG